MRQPHLGGVFASVLRESGLKLSGIQLEDFEAGQKEQRLSGFLPNGILHLAAQSTDRMSGGGLCSSST